MDPFTPPAPSDRSRPSVLELPGLRLKSVRPITCSHGQLVYLGTLIARDTRPSSCTVSRTPLPSTTISSAQLQQQSSSTTNCCPATFGRVLFSFCSRLQGLWPQSLTIRIAGRRILLPQQHLWSHCCCSHSFSPISFLLSLPAASIPRRLHSVTFCTGRPSSSVDCEPRTACITIIKQALSPYRCHSFRRFSHLTTTYNEHYFLNFRHINHRATRYSQLPELAARRDIRGAGLYHSPTNRPLSTHCPSRL